MARVAVNGLAELSKQITQLADAGDAIGKMAVYDGAKVIADEVRRQIGNLPEDEERYLTRGDQYGVVTETEKKDLAKSLGVSTIERNAEGVRTVIGFAGYGSKPTKKYPNGLPMPLLARAIESGSSVRKKHPFMRKAVNAKQKEAKRVMVETGERQIKQTIGEKG
jgi:HK97 gp10 family phage protein